MKKRILALALSMTMIWCSALNIALAEEAVGEGNNTEIAADETEEKETEVKDGVIASGECGTDVKWVLEDDGTLTISGSGKMVFEDSAPWGSYKENIKKTVIESGVTSIAEGAFDDCSKMANIDIPDTVQSIGGCAFYGCESLTSVKIPEGVTKIEWKTFCLCSSLKKIVIPDTVTSIEYMTFNGCQSLTDITLSNAISIIENYTFYGCKSLKEIKIPDGVTSIGAYAFCNSSSLEEISIPESVTSFGRDAFYGTPWKENSMDENGLLIVNNILVECESEAEEINVPESVTGINSCAFYSNSNIKKVTLPESVTKIGDSSFKNCENLADVNVPSSVTEIQYETFSGCASLAEVELPDNLTKIGERAFLDTGLKSIKISKKVTTLEEKSVGYETVKTEDGNTEEVQVEGFTIYGYAGSAAETYANDSAINFVAYEEPETPVAPENPEKPENPEDPVVPLEIVPEKTDETYVKGSGKDLVIYCTGEYSKFVSVEMDGVLVDSANYKVEEGSTVLTFASSYLDTLSTGRHTVTLNYVDVSISTYITILDADNGNSTNNGSGTNNGNNAGASGSNGTANKNNASTNNGKTNNTVKTGDNANVMLWFILGVMAIAVGAVTVFKMRKKSA